MIQVTITVENNGTYPSSNSTLCKCFTHFGSHLTFCAALFEAFLQ